MIYSPVSIPGPLIVSREDKHDKRGLFARSFCSDDFEQNGLFNSIAQINVSVSFVRGTIRGLHYQKEPFSDAKLVRCVRGEIFDVAVDLRKRSDYFGKWVSTELSAQNGKMFYLPKGFAHGFQCLSDDVELLYLHSEKYRSDFDGGIYYNDPSIGIEWPLPLSEISEKDHSLPHLSSSEEVFL